MSLILNIDTSGTMAAISIADKGIVLAKKVNDAQKEHASFLQAAIKHLFETLNLDMSAIDAVAVVIGPGSYTGLRVGLASAKGICYALNKPLISIGTLPLMAKAALENVEDGVAASLLYCPMIDARRQEVFTAIFKSNLEEVWPAQAHILNDDSFVATLLHHKILFFGDGAAKFHTMTSNANAMFAGIYNPLEALARFSFEKFSAKDFTTLAYSEPLYLKEFYNGQ